MIDLEAFAPKQTSASERRVWWDPLGSANGEELAGDRRYRLMLWHPTPAGGPAPLVFLMLNPGTAHPVSDGPTVKKCLALAEREGAGGIVIVNLCALTTPRPERLVAAYLRGKDVFLAAENDRAIMRAAKFGPLVCAWGHNAQYSFVARRVSYVLGLLRGVDLYHFGTTREGHPRHPRRLPLDAPLLPL